MRDSAFLSNRWQSLNIHNRAYFTTYYVGIPNIISFEILRQLSVSFLTKKQKIFFYQTCFVYLHIENRKYSDDKFENVELRQTLQKSLEMIKISDVHRPT